VKAQNNELTTAGMLRLAQGTHQLISQSNSNEWYTPPEYIEAARSVMGAIDLDPASNEIAQEWIKATAYYTAEDNGLAHEWHGRIWLNPPWGRLTGDFVEKLAEEIAAGRVTEAVVLVNAHATDTDWFSPLWDGLLCFTDHRINYVSPDDVSSGSTHGSVFVYFGRNHECFGRHFGRWGTLVRRVRYDD
jgi:phage N-6-adenine-methyltransferase